jgi:DNA-binding NarL/FixJ family response regulator
MTSQTSAKPLRWYFQELKSEAENGLDALQKAQQVKPDLIILDFSTRRLPETA